MCGAVAHGQDVVMAGDVAVAGQVVGTLGKPGGQAIGTLQNTHSRFCWRQRERERERGERKRERGGEGERESDSDYSHITTHYIPCTENHLKTKTDNTK